MRRLAFKEIRQSETKSAQSIKRGEIEEIRPSLMATSLHWRTQVKFNPKYIIVGGERRGVSEIGLWVHYLGNCKMSQPLQFKVRVVLLALVVLLTM